MQVQFIKKNLLVIATLCLLMTEVGAAGEPISRANGEGVSRDQVRKIMESCFQSAGLTKPAPGERPTAPTPEQRLSIDTCLKENNIQPPTHREGQGGLPHERSAAVQ